LNSQARTVLTLSARQEGSGGDAVFSEAEDFAAALRSEGVLGVLVTGAGEFRARLTQVALHNLRLSAADEHQPRIALVTVPAGMILVTLARGRAPGPIWGGVQLGTDSILTLGAGQRLHMRTDGHCRWGSIWLPAADLARYGTVMTGARFAVPSTARSWRLKPVLIRHLHHLHSAGIAAIERRSNAFIGNETAHGLEQQLIEALIDCLSHGLAIEAVPAIRTHQDVAIRFEAFLQAHPDRAPLISAICSALGVSARTLRRACKEQLGMDPAEYVRRCRMQHLGHVPTRWRLTASCKQ
jgi:hypothetical protein